MQRTLDQRAEIDSEVAISVGDKRRQVEVRRFLGCLGAMDTLVDASNKRSKHLLALIFTRWLDRHGIGQDLAALQHAADARRRLGGGDDKHVKVAYGFARFFCKRIRQLRGARRVDIFGVRGHERIEVVKYDQRRRVPRSIVEQLLQACAHKRHALLDEMLAVDNRGVVKQMRVCAYTRSEIFCNC